VNLDISSYQSIYILYDNRELISKGSLRKTPASQKKQESLTKSFANERKKGLITPHDSNSF